jgi:hypothetical protein
MDKTKPTYRNTEINQLRNVDTTDEVFNLTYTPYIKFVHHYLKAEEPEKDPKINEFYFLILFLSKKGTLITNTTTKKNGNLIEIDIEVNSGNSNDDIITQLTINADDIGDIGETKKELLKGKNFNYIVTVKHGVTLDKKFNLGGSNSAGGTTDPHDPYPPAKK